MYHDNLEFLKESFRKVTIVNAIKDEKIPTDADVVFIVGGYIETKEAYERIENSYEFKNSLFLHAKENKAIYGECAGLLFLSNCVDDKKMMGLLNLDFTLGKRFYRMGYYENDLGITGHAFHYTRLVDENTKVFTSYIRKMLVMEHMQLFKIKMFLEHIYILCLEIIFIR